LKPATFTDQEDVEEFIQELSNVVAITQRLPWVALIQLWLALTKQAKPYGQVHSVNRDLCSLQTRFGMSAVDARVCLHGLRHDPCTPLREHVATVKKLSQITYGDLTHLQIDAFVQFLNDLGLHHQFLAREVVIVEDTLRECETYLLAIQLHRGCVSSV